jgi:hypothetical protein
MTAHDPKKRYNHIDLALVDLIKALSAIAPMSDGIIATEDMKKELIKCLRSSNAATQQKAHQLARRLEKDCLPELHEELGGRRLDATIAAYRILGELRYEESLPFLIAGLYPRRSAQKMRFPTGEHAANSLAGYPDAVRLAVLNQLQDIVRPQDMEIIVTGLQPKAVFPSIQNLFARKMLYSDWDSPSAFRLFLKVDEEMGWPLVWERLSQSNNIYSWRIFQDIYPYVNLKRKKQILDHLLAGPHTLSSFELPRIADAICHSGFDEGWQKERLNRLIEVSNIVIKRWDDRNAFQGSLKKTIIQIEINGTD